MIWGYPGVSFLKYVLPHKLDILLIPLNTGQVWGALVRIPSINQPEFLAWPGSGRAGRDYQNDKTQTGAESLNI